MKYYKDPSELDLYKAPESRLRSRSTLKAAAPSSRWYWWNTGPNGIPAKPALVSEGTVGLYESMSDWKTDRFKERSSNGEIINMPMSKTTATWDILSTTVAQSKSVQGSYTYYGEIEGVKMTGATPGSYDSIIATMVSRCGTLGSPDYAQMDALVATEARAAIAQPDFAGLVSLGELGETLRYLKNPFATGLKLADKLHRRLDKIDHSNGHVAANLASVYLEFRYAVRPLVKEVESALLNLQNTGLRFDRKTARAKQVWARSDVVTTPNVQLGTTDWYYDERVSRKREFTLKSGFLYAHELSSGLPDRWGTRLSDIPTAMWELIPLSFVYDWVGNVGDFIGALTPRAGVNILSQWTTREDSMELDLLGTGHRIVYTGWSRVSSGTTQVKGTCVFKTRSPIVSAPSIAWRGFDKISSDALKVLDLIGIFGQKLDNAAQVAMRKQGLQDAMVRKGERLTKRLNRF